MINDMISLILYLIKTEICFVKKLSICLFISVDVAQERTIPIKMYPTDGDKDPIRI